MADGNFQLQRSMVTGEQILRSSCCKLKVLAQVSKEGWHREVLGHDHHPPHHHYHHQGACSGFKGEVPALQNSGTLGHFAISGSTYTSRQD